MIGYPGCCGDDSSSQLPNGFIEFAVFTFNIEVCKKCVIRTATISGNGTQ